MENNGWKPCTCDVCCYQPSDVPIKKIGIWKIIVENLSLVMYVNCNLENNGWKPCTCDVCCYQPSEVPRKKLVFWEIYQKSLLLQDKIVSQIELNIPTYSKENLPSNLQALKAVKPGSRNLK